MLQDYGLKMLEYTLGAADSGVEAVACDAAPTGTEGRVVDLGSKYAEGIGVQPNSSNLLWKCYLGTDAATTGDSVAITLQTSVDEAFSSPIEVVKLGAIVTADLTAARVLWWGLIGTTICTIKNSTTHGGVFGSCQTYLRRYVRTKVVTVASSAFTAGVIHSELGLWYPNSANRRIFALPE